MNFLISYWWIILIGIAVIAIGGYFGYMFIKAPLSSQIAKVKEWLLYAVTEAEKELGSGTGQIKLRYVYDRFLVKFPYLTKIISFENFSSMVDEVLEKFRNLLNTNKSIQDYVDNKGGKSKDE